MKVSEITAYLIKLEREGFTGQIRLNFHKGNLAYLVEKKESVLVKDPMEVGEDFKDYKPGGSQ